MSPRDTPVTDDAVAALLIRDANRRSDSKYELLPGAFSGVTSRRREDAPKPNTRFLKNILRDTDQHNAVLKRREEAESRARLDALKSSASSDNQPQRREVPARKLGSERKDRWSQALAGLGNEAHKLSSRRKERHSDRSAERPSRKHDARTSRRPRSSSPARSRLGKERARSRSPRKEHSRQERHRSPLAIGQDQISRSPVRRRGRGTQGSSKIDERFHSNYDPKNDVGHDLSDDEQDDWTGALEALRDRARWRQIGAERLKDAGFSEQEIGRWERGDAKGIDDVKWRSKAEEREWDRGKTVGEGGAVELKAEWTRQQRE